MDAEHAVESAQAVAVVDEFLVAVAAEASSAVVVDVDWLAVEALAAQVAGNHLLGRGHPEAEALPALLCKAGLSAPKDL